MCECVCNQGHRIKGKCKNIYTKQTDECVREFACVSVCVCCHKACLVINFLFIKWPDLK